MESSIEIYIVYCWRLIQGFNNVSISPESLIKLAMIYPEGQKIVPNYYDEMALAHKAIQAIKDGKSPFLKYDSDKDLIYNNMVFKQSQGRG